MIFPGNQLLEGISFCDPSAQLSLLAFFNCSSSRGPKASDNMIVSWALASVVAASALYSVYTYLIYPLFVSPTRHIPAAYWSARVSQLWILWIRYTEVEIDAIHSAHGKLGPVVLLAPNEISVNSFKGGIQAVYAGGFEKHEWYPRAFVKHGCYNMFSTLKSRPHSIRKRMMSNIYSRSYLQGCSQLSEVSKSILYSRLLPRLEVYAQTGESFNIFDIFNAATFDFVAGYLFGASAARNVANMLESPAKFQDFFAMHNDRGNGHRWFYIQELPRLTQFLSRFGLSFVPPMAQSAFDEVENFGLEFCDGAAAAMKKYNAETVSDMPEDAIGDFPTVYAQLRSSLSRNASKEDGLRNNSDDIQLQIASELTDQFLAGFETSGITLIYYAYELSKRPELQAALRKELLTLDPPISLEQIGQGGKLPSAKALDALPLLQATLQETLRHHAAIPGPQPRVTPTGGCTLGPEGNFTRIPGGMRISAQAWSLHRNADVFPSPDSWQPERWLTASDEQLREMHRWFWAFGSGGRMCVGSNLAIFQMKHIIAAIWTNWRSVIVDDDGIKQSDAYTAPPIGRRLIVRLEPWEQ